MLEITSALITDAITLSKLHGLRAYDAVQLAVALNFNRRQLSFNLKEVVMVSADNELLTAAKAEGLLTEDPNNYP